MNRHVVSDSQFRHVLVASIFSLLSLAFMDAPLLAKEPTLATGSTEETATYAIQFNATWSADTHPHTPFPTSSAHFSPLIGAVHGVEVSFWRPGMFASEGIEQMAETGGTGGLRAEIANAIASGDALSVISGGGADSPGSIDIEEIELNQAFPNITLVTMIAPSPDWFVGISSESLQDEQGDWIAERTFTLYPYDAGTDSGEQYVSANEDTLPAQPVRSLRNQTPFSDAPIGTFTVTRVIVPKMSVYLPWIAQ